MTDGVRTDSAAARWRGMVDAHRAQSERLRDPAWRGDRDFAPPSVDSFRADRERDDDARLLQALQALAAERETVIDVGAGAGRFAIPLARSGREVIAIEPSATMRTALADDAARADVRNLRIVEERWEQASPIRGDLVFAAHVVYPIANIVPFVQRLNDAAQRWAALVVFEAPPLSWLLPFWERVHGQDRLPPPHLPQVVDVVNELGYGPPIVDLIDVAPFDLGPAALARQKLRRRLYVAPDTEHDRRLSRAMAELLDERDGVLVPRTEHPIRVGLVRWLSSR